jgi:hypothetical protein
MSTNQIGIIHFHNPQNIEETAKWDKLFNSVIPPSNGAFLVVSDIIDIIDNIDRTWEPFTEEELSEGAKKYWADIYEPGIFDIQKTLLNTAMSFCYNRQLTRCELILVMKCEFLSKFRLQAIDNNFDSSKPICSDPSGCTTKCKNQNCICSKIPFL